MSTSIIKTEAPAPAPSTNPLALGLFLSGIPLLSAFILIADLRGLLPVLGWSKSPGYFILFLLFAFGIFALFRHESPTKVSISSALLVIPVYLDLICAFVRRFADIFPVSSALWLWMAFLPILLGCCYVYRMRLPIVVKVGYLIVSAYIGAVHLYNEGHLGQHMGFFGGGWTA